MWESYILAADCSQAINWGQHQLNGNPSIGGLQSPAQPVPASAVRGQRAVKLAPVVTAGDLVGLLFPAIMSGGGGAVELAKAGDLFMASRPLLGGSRHGKL